MNTIAEHCVDTIEVFRPGALWGDGLPEPVYRGRALVQVRDAARAAMKPTAR